MSDGNSQPEAREQQGGQQPDHVQQGPGHHSVHRPVLGGHDHYASEVSNPELIVPSILLTLKL